MSGGDELIGGSTVSARAATLPDPILFPLFPDVPLYRFDVTLDGVPFTLRLDYSGREDRWYLAVYDAQGVKVRSGMKVTSNWNTLRQCQNEGRPAGVLVFSDPRRPDSAAPAFAELGRRVLLFYFPGAA